MSEPLDSPKSAALNLDGSALGSISIVIPAYNEEQHIGDTLAQVMRFAAENTAVCEVIVVDDGSIDRTASIVENVQDEYAEGRARLRLITHGTNMGKGASVSRGVLAAKGDVVVFTDADLSSPISFLWDLAQPVLDGACDLAIASRAIGRGFIQAHQRLSREISGRLFNLFVRLWIGLDIRDTQCGFKAFRRSAILPVFHRQRLKSFAFDVEVLYLADRSGLTIREVALPWSHVQLSNIRLLKDSARMFFDCLRIRVYDIFGLYQTERY